MFVADWHIPVLKALRGLMIAMVLAALGLGPWRPDTNLPQAPDGLLVMSSAFLIATFSIIIVVYNLQWGHFAKKEAPDKRAAARISQSSRDMGTQAARGARGAGLGPPLWERRRRASRRRA